MGKKVKKNKRGKKNAKYSNKEVVLRYNSGVDKVSMIGVCLILAMLPTILKDLNCDSVSDFLESLSWIVAIIGFLREK